MDGSHVVVTLFRIRAWSSDSNYSFITEDMKATLRVPTQEMYAYIEVSDIEGTPEEILSTYRELTDMVKSSSSIGDKEFNAVMDELLETHKISGDPGVMEQMSGDQRMLIQAIKRSFARINNRNK